MPLGKILFARPPRIARVRNQQFGCGIAMTVRTFVVVATGVGVGVLIVRPMRMPMGVDMSTVAVHVIMKVVIVRFVPMVVGTCGRRTDTCAKGK